MDQQQRAKNERLQVGQLDLGTSFEADLGLGNVNVDFQFCASDSSRFGEVLTIKIQIHGSLVSRRALQKNNVKQEFLLANRVHNILNKDFLQNNALWGVL